MTRRTLSLTFFAALAPWAAPHEVASPPSHVAFRPIAAGVEFNAAGRGAVAWVTESTADEIGDRIAAAAAPKGADVFGAGVIAREAERVGASTTGNLALYGSSRIAFAGITSGERPAVGLTTLSALGGGRRLTLLHDRRARSSYAAGNARGDLAVATLASRRGGFSLGDLAPFLAVKRAGRRSGRAVRIGGFGPVSGALDVAMNDSGDVLVAWERRGRVLARVRHRGRLGPVQRLGRGHDPRISAAIAAGRRATVVWQTATGVRLARAGRGGRFRIRRLVERTDVGRGALACGVRLVEVAYATRRDPVAAWTARAGDHLVVRATSLGTSTGQTVSDPAQDGCLDDLATGPDGEAAVLWSQGRVDMPQTLAGAVRDPGGAAFSAPETITATARAGAAFAFDPATGRLVAAWADADGKLMSAAREPLTTR
jgi:hypothetical protein